jgi:hypothetical protein
MSKENVEAVREIYRGWALGDFTVGINFFDPEIEFVSDFGPDRVTAHGLDDMRRVWREHLRNWESWRTGEIQELRDFDGCLFATHSVHGRGRESGIEVEIVDAGAASGSTRAGSFGFSSPTGWRSPSKPPGCRSRRPPPT